MERWGARRRQRVHLALLCPIGWLLATPPAAALETPGAAVVEGVSLGMRVEQVQRALVSRGFVAEEESRHAYSNDLAPVRRIVGFRSVPGLAGPVVSQIEYTVLYPLEDFDPVRAEREVRVRFGEPRRESRSGGRIELQYLEVSDAPSVGDVVDACLEEVQRKWPELSPLRAQIRAEGAGEYHPHNALIERTCPGALPIYRRMAEAVEAPRMTVVIWPGTGRVDTDLSWPLLSTPMEPTDAPPARNACPVWR